MLVYHQCGHNFVWNLDSFVEDEVGDGLIVSPVNVPSDRLPERFPPEVRSQSWFDPQFYLPHDNKGGLASYPFFPGNILDDFTTADFSSHAGDIADRCLRYQAQLGFRYMVAPTRYFADLPADHLDQLNDLFVTPFLHAWRQHAGDKPMLVTHIVRPSQIAAGIARDELITWLTGIRDISGVYLIFDSDFSSKQIKDPSYLVGVMRFIHAMRANDLEVHVGYAGLEALLLSCADPTSVSVGAWENLRSFNIKRMETQERRVQRSPRPRIYSPVLLQSVEDTYLGPLRELVPGFEELFAGTRYSEYVTASDTPLSSQRPEVHKHYFAGIAQQIGALPALSERPRHVRGLVRVALQRFEDVDATGVYLDGDSDGSHLPSWLNAIAMFEAQAW